jgi:hypothetical protein
MEDHLAIKEQRPEVREVVTKLGRSLQDHDGLWGGYNSAKQNFRPHKTRNYCGYISWNYH